MASSPTLQIGSLQQMLTTIRNDPVYEPLVSALTFAYLPVVVQAIRLSFEGCLAKNGEWPPVELVTRKKKRIQVPTVELFVRFALGPPAVRHYILTARTTGFSESRIEPGEFIDESDFLTERLREGFSTLFDPNSVLFPECSWKRNIRIALRKGVPDSHTGSGSIEPKKRSAFGRFIGGCRRDLLASLWASAALALTGDSFGRQVLRWDADFKTFDSIAFLPGCVSKALSSSDITLDEAGQPLIPGCVVVHGDINPEDVILFFMEPLRAETWLELVFVSCIPALNMIHSWFTKNTTVDDLLKAAVVLSPIIEAKVATMNSGDHFKGMLFLGERIEKLFVLINMGKGSMKLLYDAIFHNHTLLALAWAVLMRATMRVPNEEPNQAQDHDDEGELQTQASTHSNDLSLQSGAHSAGALAALQTGQPNKKQRNVGVLTLSTAEKVAQGHWYVSSLHMKIVGDVMKQHKALKDNTTPLPRLKNFLTQDTVNRMPRIGKNSVLSSPGEPDQTSGSLAERVVIINDI